MAVCHMLADKSSSPVASGYIWKQLADDGEEQLVWCWYYGWMQGNIPFARGVGGKSGNDNEARRGRMASK